MTTEDEHPEENDAIPADEDPSTEDMKAFLQALNHFVHEVAIMDWPEQFQLDNDEKFCFSVFRTFWRQRHRQSEQRGGNRRFHMRFEGADAGVVEAALEAAPASFAIFDVDDGFDPGLGEQGVVLGGEAVQAERAQARIIG